MPKKANPALKFTGSMLKYAAVVGVAVGASWWVIDAKASEPAETPKPDQPHLTAVTPHKPVDPAAPEVVRPSPHVDPELKRQLEAEMWKGFEEAAFSPYVSAVGTQYAIANGSVVRKGGELDGWTLKGVSIDDGATLWMRGDLALYNTLVVRPTQSYRSPIE